MPLSKAHKAQSREKIIAAAGRLFRAHGYEGVGVDAIMSEAGLTRGGFYNHFPTKAALFAEVLGADYGLVQQLSDRHASKADSPLGKQTRQIFRDYLNPDHFYAVGPGCTFAALSNDAARTDEEGRAKFTETYRRMVSEMTRGQAEQHEADTIAHATLALAIGAVTIARGLDDSALTADLLHAASQVISNELLAQSGLEDVDEQQN